MELLSVFFRKLLFFNDEMIQKKIEVSFGKFIAFSGETWKDLVDTLCSLNIDLKRTYEEQNKLLVQENLTLKENLEIQKNENSKVLNNYLNVERTIKEIYDKEIKKYEEKVMIFKKKHYIIIYIPYILLKKFIQNNLYLQKILNENAKLSHIYQNEKQKSEQVLKQNVSSLTLQLEKMNQVIY